MAVHGCSSAMNSSRLSLTGENKLSILTCVIGTGDDQELLFIGLHGDYRAQGVCIAWVLGLIKSEEG